MICVMEKCKVTAIIVSYMQTDLLRRCYESIRKFYIDLPVIIIDGSEPDSDCWAYSMSLAGQFTTVRNVEYNIGHGPGLKLGILLCETEFFLIVDSDVIIDRAPVEKMMYMMELHDAYGVGQIVFVNEHGGNVEKGYQYLHPHFALISKAKYLKYAPIIHHGAPLIKSMIDIDGKHLLIGFPVSLFVTHLGRGTRALNPPEFQPGTWEK